MNCKTHVMVGSPFSMMRLRNRCLYLAIDWGATPSISPSSLLESKPKRISKQS